MSDCRVPMKAYPKDLLKPEEVEEGKDELPPIPEGWMAFHFPNSIVGVTNHDQGFFPGGKKDMTISNYGPYDVFWNHSFNPFKHQDLEVLVLIKEKK